MKPSETLADVMSYICTNYPYPEDLSKARLTKLVYLADWVSAQKYGRTITDIDWVFNHYGPYVPDVGELAKNSEDFEVVRGTNAYGSVKETIRAIRRRDLETLSDKDVEIIDFVIRRTRHLNFTEFLRSVYSTYPIRQSDRYDRMDLVSMATERVQNRAGNDAT